MIKKPSLIFYWDSNPGPFGSQLLTLFIIVTFNEKEFEKPAMPYCV